jgi:hypothetical protein
MERWTARGADRETDGWIDIIVNKSYKILRKLPQHFLLVLFRR